jgi:PAS domain-containing protein
LSDRQKIKIESQEQFTERFDLALWATKTAIWDWDIARGVMWRSSGQQFIYGGEEIESSREFDIEDDDDPWILRLHPEDRAIVVQGLRTYLQTNASQSSESLYSVEYRYRRPNDEYIWIRSISRAI